MKRLGSTFFRCFFPENFVPFAPTLAHLPLCPCARAWMGGTHPCSCASLPMCDPSSWGYVLPRFGVAPRVGDTDSQASVWPLELGIRTPMKMRMRTLFVSIAAVVMHLMGMTFSFVRVHILPQLVGTSCA